ncbi:DUF2147 domain-containing protein [Bradyrhizobium japonicum]|uniref:DUF2147 domain-containing protein n=1 Tax=Bradyrhizobium japonicum TaxID=375 RepID=UPI001B8A2EAF|nr:DUF2147 domain-containing protein [Bradyrhizobium japonicum]MBR0972820.1 DUF2147 domain-containing protein [Bradyrhizobium japonicum]
MTRLVTSLGIVIALTAMAPAAQAGSYAFSVGGHRFHIEAARNCRSSSCVSISSRSLRPAEDVGTTPPPPPAPAPIVQAPQPVYPVAPVRPVQASVVTPPPAPPAPVLAAATSQPVAPPPAPRFEAPTNEPLSPNPPRIDFQRVEPPKAVTLAPPVVASSPEIKETSPIAQRSDDEPAYLPLGEWESTGAKGTVRIERCGPALCGFALTEASSRGESVLVNMKPKTHDVWTGSIYSRSSGSTYYGKMTLTSTGKLHVEACAFGRFWCSGNDWTRVEERQEKLVTTSGQWSARS